MCAWLVVLGWPEEAHSFKVSWWAGLTASVPTAVYMVMFALPHPLFLQFWVACIV